VNWPNGDPPFGIFAMAQGAAKEVPKLCDHTSDQAPTAKAMCSLNEDTQKFWLQHRNVFFKIMDVIIADLGEY